MRYVDIDQIQLPNGWEDRARAELDGLRVELQQAEAAAVALGTDPQEARKKAIKDGLHIGRRQNVWRELAQPLAALSHGKCWYSESKNPTADKNVDHFRPKGRVEEDEVHGGYWWLAFNWRNFRYASQWCNQRRNDSANGTSGGKADRFPLCHGSFRAAQESDDLTLEQVELLDPTDPEDWKLLTFRPDGRPTPVSAAGTAGFTRAAVSIEAYHLNCHELVEERRALASRLQRIVDEMDRLLPRINDPHIRLAFLNQEKELLRLIHERADYSASALAYARQALIKFEGGAAVKRTWLEQVLNLHQ